MNTSSIVGLGLLIVIFIGGAMFGLPAFNRYQSRAEAQNQVSINEIVIQQQAQNIQVEEQKAQIRIVDAMGVASSTKIIDSTLTDSYLQYLAIQAQQAMANGSNHTEIYIPSGFNGIPLVKPIGQ